MKRLPYTKSNVKIVQNFLDETKERISNGVSITFTNKAQSELALLNLTYDISTTDIENAILNLTSEDYYRGIDPSRKTDFEVCVFFTQIGKDNVGVYLKYGLETAGLQILVFSNHVPLYDMDQPFKK